MLEMSPDFGFGVLSPAFKGNENEIAVQEYAENGCTFLKDDLCELFGSGLEPLECRFTHHARLEWDPNAIRRWKGTGGRQKASNWLSVGVRKMICFRVTVWGY